MLVNLSGKTSIPGSKKLLTRYHAETSAPPGRLHSMPNEENPRSKWALLRAWMSDWGNALAVLLAVYCFGFIATQQLRIFSPPTLLVAQKLAFLPLNIGTAALAIRAALHANAEPRIRRALFLFGASYLTILLSNVLQFYVGMIEKGDAYASPVNFVG